MSLLTDLLILTLLNVIKYKTDKDGNAISIYSYENLRLLTHLHHDEIILVDLPSYKGIKKALECIETTGFIPTKMWKNLTS